MSAVLSDDGRYRYSLTRSWEPDLPHDLWVMCNASTADHTVDDPTITRCRGFSQRFGSGGFSVVNAYGYRASRPAALWSAARHGIDIVGPRNDYWIRIRLLYRPVRIIAAWGIHPKPDRVRQLVFLLREFGVGRELMCLGLTKAGQPRHPLMLRADAELRPFTVPG